MLLPGQDLRAIAATHYDKLESKNGRYRLVLEGFSGNIVIRDRQLGPSNEFNDGAAPAWISGTTEDVPDEVNRRLHMAPTGNMDPINNGLFTPTGKLSADDLDAAQLISGTSTLVIEIQKKKKEKGSTRLELSNFVQSSKDVYVRTGSDLEIQYASGYYCGWTVRCISNL